MGLQPRVPGPKGAPGPTGPAGWLVVLLTPGPALVSEPVLGPALPTSLALPLLAELTVVAWAGTT